MLDCHLHAAEDAIYTLLQQTCGAAVHTDSVLRSFDMLRVLRSKPYSVVATHAMYKQASSINGTALVQKNIATRLRKDTAVLHLHYCMLVTSQQLLERRIKAVNARGVAYKGITRLRAYVAANQCTQVKYTVDFVYKLLVHSRAVFFAVHSSAAVKVLFNALTDRLMLTMFAHWMVSKLAPRNIVVIAGTRTALLANCLCEHTTVFVTRAYAKSFAYLYN